MSQLKNITFIFENCECLTVDGKHIGEFLVTDIKKSIERVACNAVRELNVAQTVVIEIRDLANCKRELYPGTPEKYQDTVFDRLKRGDITGIEFKLEERDGNIKEYSYLTSWTGDSEYTNDAQDVATSECGHLYLVISKNDSITTMFDKSRINDKKQMDSYWKTFDICNKHYRKDTIMEKEITAKGTGQENVEIESGETTSTRYQEFIRKCADEFQKGREEQKKSMLLLDTPENCNTCKVCMGKICVYMMKDIENKEEKPDWCPLNPLN